MSGDKPKARKWRFGGGTPESNIDGFELLRGDALRAAIESLPDSDPLRLALAADAPNRQPETPRQSPPQSEHEA